MMCCVIQCVSIVLACLPAPMPVPIYSMAISVQLIKPVYTSCNHVNIIAHTYSSTVLITYQKDKYKTLVESVDEVKAFVAERWNLNEGVTLEYFDKTFDEWVIVDEHYNLKPVEKLRVVSLQKLK